jgi:hypothetical protein
MGKLRTLTAVVLFSSVALALAVITVSAGPPNVTPDVVMSGLDNPRGLGFGPDGALYVAEAGRGGPPGPDQDGDGTADNCLIVRGELHCAGDTGAISRLKNGRQKQIATGMPSYAIAGNEAIGPHDISFHGATGWITIGLGGEPSARPVWPGEDFGRLVRMRPNGRWSFSTDVAEYEESHNPDGFVPDSNPYGILAERRSKVVTDAGGNDLLRISADGEISTIAVFPARPGRPTDAVPTSVARGHDGAYYVGELTGVPFAVGAANIYRVEEGEAPEVHLSGFTAVIDIAFGCDRKTLYVLQHATGPFLSGPGTLIRVAPNGSRALVETPLLTYPTSVAISCGDDGDDDHRNAHGNDGDDDDGDDDDGDNNREVIYISNKGQSAGIGEVLRIRNVTLAPPTKVEIRLSNIDDNAQAYVNGVLRLTAGYTQDTGFVDVSSSLQPGSNSLRFVLQNIGLGWTYNFEIRKDGATVFAEACGQVGVMGCMNNDGTLGTVYDKTVTVTVP